MIVRQPESRAKRIFLICFALGIMVPGAYGFIEKLIAFIQSVGTKESGGFAIIPVLNYFIVALGFGCLLIWAIAHGMFRDVERPKYTMLDREKELDRLEGRQWSDDAS